MTAAEPSHSTELPISVSASGRSAAGMRWSRQVAVDIVAIGDCLAVVLGAAVPAVIYAKAGAVIGSSTLLVQSALASAIITHICLRSWQMYDTQRLNDFPQYPGKLFLALLAGIGGLIGLGLPSAVQNIHLTIWFLTWLAASFSLLVLNRGIAATVLARLTASGVFHERVAVYGAGEIARRVQAYLSNPALGIEFAGTYDDRAGTPRIDAKGLKINAGLDGLILAARNEEIDRIIIALPQSADRRIAEVARKLEQSPSSIHIVTHISSDLIEGTKALGVSHVGPVGLLDVKRKPLADWAPMVKAVEDRLIGCALFIVAAPLFPLIALLIRLDSPGPVIFRQRRRGLNHRIFEVYKFRTMHVLEDGNVIPQARPGDVRVTRVGRILRRTSLDELPQLINVLKGDMSLVGPRPHALVHDEKFGEMLESYANRHQVKPGITGLAQVRGFRGDASSADKVEARVNADIDYIRNWSLGLDMRILCQTVRAVVVGENAH